MNKETLKSIIWGFLSSLFMYIFFFIIQKSDANLEMLFFISTLMATLIGITIAVSTTGIIRSFTTLFIAGLLVLAGLLNFKVFNIKFPWLFLAIFFLVPLLITIFRKSFESFINEKMAKTSFTQYWDEETSKSFLAENHSFDPEDCLVSIVFINFGEFSLVSEKISPFEAFGLLKDVIHDVTTVIHDYEGMVISINGSELIAIFGYSPNKNPDHALRAVLAAIEIQKSQLLKNISLINLEKPIINFKIGINTSSSYIGKIKDSFPLKLVALGQGVKLAKLFESASDYFSITIGAMTKDMLGDVEKLGINPIKKMVQLKKSFSTFYETYEINPCEEEKKHQVISYYRRYLGKQRRSERWTLPTQVSIFVNRAFTDEGKGELINFSHDGLCINFDQYLGVGSHISLILDNESGNLKSSMKSLDLLPIIGEIRWGKVNGPNSFTMGLEITNLTKTQKDAMVHLLRTCLSFNIKAAINQ